MADRATVTRALATCADENIADALRVMLVAPFDCSHCRRIIPADVVSSFDGSRCPLEPQCVKRASGILTAWPEPPPSGDDDDREPVGPLPVLSGGVA